MRVIRKIRKLKCFMITTVLIVLLILNLYLKTNNKSNNEVDKDSLYKIKIFCIILTSPAGLYDKV